MTQFALIAVGVLLIVLVVLLASRVVRGAVLSRGRGPRGEGVGGLVSAVVGWILLWLIVGAVAVPIGLVYWFINMWRAPAERTDWLFNAFAIVWLVSLPAGLLLIVAMREVTRAARRRGDEEGSGRR